MSANTVTVDGLPAIQYGNVQFFRFNLGAGQDDLTVNAAVLTVDVDNAISAGTIVTISGGGQIDLNGKTDIVRGEVLDGGSIVNGTLIGTSHIATRTARSTRACPGPEGSPRAVRGQ